MLKKLSSNSFFSYILISLSVIILYTPTLNNGFFNIDDEKLVLNNPYIKDISFKNFIAIFNPSGIPASTEKAYKPLRSASFMIDYALGGYNPSVYHMGNLIIYLITCLLLYRILVDQIRHSALWVVAFFALHPVHTEPVAWVSARSDLLAGFFCLLSFFAYQKSISKRTSLTYAGSIIFWILAFFSKSVAVAFPMVIVGYDICVRSKPWRQNLIRWSPFIFLSIMACFFSIYRARITGHIYDDFLFFSDRLLYIALLVQRYILTTLVPLRLSFYYTPFPDLSQIVFEVVLSLSLCLLLIMLGLFWWLKDKKKVFILILFFTFLLPVIQIIPFPVMQADRYLFYSVLSIAIILGWVMEILLRHKQNKLRLTLGVGILMFYFSISWQRVQYWKSSVFIWQDAVSKSSRPFAKLQLGRAYFKEEQYKKALDNFLRVTEEKPNYYGGFYWAGRSLMSLGRLNEADFFLKKSKNISPDNSHSYYQLGLISLWQENLENSEKYLQKAIAIEPQFWEAYYLLGLTYIKSDKPGQALEKLCKSLHPSNKNYDDALKEIRKLGPETCRNE
tara:strand:+ start:4073 stop:5755 length:1683 start_codon:yes stop_codon:yes gene_type:complete